MSDVTLTIDGTDVTVPAGTGLVEAAAELGVEIPIFCYEPRLGPAVGACRMCLVEIEGVPKLQAACATAVRPGMVVSTVGDKARDAQEAVLEFLLLNHPLDCPVCDKGGECPLQDHAFRWGPGTSRFVEQKRTGDKPIPISPLIALDRERCILCYRCTRFSAEVSEDTQLITRQRGAKSVIATFEGRPYEAHHSGNVIELCPVGALTSTQYRFNARPWEATDHPSIAGWDPAGSNVFHTVREGRVQRVLARRNDAVDVGWIDDRTRFAYTAMYGPARITTARLRDRAAQATDVSFEVALEWLHERLASSDGSRELWVLSGHETLETVHAVQQLAARTGGRVVAVPGASAALPAASASIADLRSARHVLVVGDADLLDVAPVLDLHVREAQRGGAYVTTVGVGGTRLEATASNHMAVPAGSIDETVARTCAHVRETQGSGPMEETGIVIFRDGELSAESLADLATTFDLPRQGAGFLAIPAAPNARGLAALDVATATWEEILGHDGGVVFLGVDPARHADAADWVAGLERAAWSVAVDTLPAAHHDAVDLVLPGAWSGEQDGTMVNLEGRLQRLTTGVEPPAGARTPLRWIAGLARRLGATEVAGHAAGAFRQLAAERDERLPVTSYAAIPPEGVLGVSGGAPAPDAANAAPSVGDGELALYVAPFLYDAAEVEHAEAMGFLRDTTRLTLAREDARAHGLGRGDRATATVDGRELDVTIWTSPRIAPGHARVHAGTPGMPAGHTGWSTVRIVAGSAAEAAATAASETGGEG